MCHSGYDEDWDLCQTIGCLLRTRIELGLRLTDIGRAENLGKANREGSHGIGAIEEQSQKYFLSTKVMFRDHYDLT